MIKHVIRSSYLVKFYLVSELNYGYVKVFRIPSTEH